MDEEEKYWSNLEQIYVHNVYEQISTKYDELLNLSQKFQEQNSMGEECVDKVSKRAENEIIKSSKSKADSLREVYRSSKTSKNNERTLSNQFSFGKNEIRHICNLWPKVKKFIQKIEPYSLIADVGCGDGKYLNVNSHVMSIGSDRSNALCRLASVKYPPPAHQHVNNQNQILVCDNLALPFRSDLFDAVISIGVIHHLSAEKRRIRALQELTRILKPNGQLLICVWAMEQRVRKFKSQDVLVPMLNSSYNNKNNLSTINNKNKFRRYLSNNSEAITSDDSNDEQQKSQVNEKFVMYHKRLIGNQIMSKSQDFPTAHHSFESGNHGNNLETNSITTFVTTKEEQRQILSKSSNENTLNNRTFVKNLRRFLSEKFSRNSSNNTSSPIPEVAISKLSETNVTVDPLCHFNSVQIYKQILEEHKDVLPENFTLRQFPYSSCLKTFGHSEQQQQQNESAEVENAMNANQNKLDQLSVCSYSLSPLSTSPCIDSDSIMTAQIQVNLDTIFVENDEIRPSESKSTSTLDFENACNKRFYHVFNRNELDMLIKEHCPSLVICDSYYDHGNWCICARKVEK